MRFANRLWGCFLGLGCVVQPPAPAPVVTIADLSPYLAQSRCPDGSIPTNCAAPLFLRASDPLLWRKHDYGTLPDGYANGYEASDGFVSDDGMYFATAWTFYSFDSFNITRGDGGEVYVVENGRVRIAATQDNGTPGVIQRFVGTSCGGSGWLAFDNQARTGTWRDEVARLSISADPNACPALNQAYTRWRWEALSVSFNLFGVPTVLPLRCLVSEHYGGSSISLSATMEQSLWCEHWGRVWWGAYAIGPSALDPSRVPALPWPGPPERPDMNLHDARLNTNIVTVGQGEAPTIEWPPQGFTP